MIPSPTHAEMGNEMYSYHNIALKNRLVHTKSQEEAALVLQKHYRGYQIRNKANSSINDNIDPASQQILKKFCNKWKGRSIYQVILLDRANKLQDVVYFSLQVHMYNQHVIYKLNNMNHQPVVLENVMTTTAVNEFLGSRKCYLYKMPFRLNQTDTTVVPKNLTMDDNCSDADDGNWDSALNRLPEARTAYKILKHKFQVRDQGVQVNNEEVVRFADTNNHHYCRPQNANSRELPSPQRDYKQNNNYTPRIKDEKISMIRPATDNRFYNGKKQDDSNNNSKTTNFANNRPANGNKPTDRSNPIHELHSKGKQFKTTYENDENDPPYNFQAILRKTNYKRPSMEERSVKYSADTFGVTSDKFARHNQTRQNGQNGHHKNYASNGKLQSKSTRTELLPGVVLEGPSDDL